MEPSGYIRKGSKVNIKTKIWSSQFLKSLKIKYYSQFTFLMVIFLNKIAILCN